MFASARSGIAVGRRVTIDPFRFARAERAEKIRVDYLDRRMRGAKRNV
jgi:hypothetical protein